MQVELTANTGYFAQPTHSIGVLILVLVVWLGIIYAAIESDRPEWVVGCAFLAFPLIIAIMLMLS